MDHAEQRISDMEDANAELLTRLERAETRLEEAAARLEDQKNRSRRNNIKIIDLKERVEGNNPRNFFEQWLPEVFNV